MIFSKVTLKYKTVANKILWRKVIPHKGDDGKGTKVKRWYRAINSAAYELCLEDPNIFYLPKFYEKVFFFFIWWGQVGIYCLF